MVDAARTTKPTKAAKSPGRRRKQVRRHSAAPTGKSPHSGNSRQMPLFERFAAAVARQTGRPATFSLAVALILAWAASGPLFHFSDTWQLVVNTSTTIITFLMVFLIQHTQNRDSLAIQIKLAELILVAKGAEDEIATAEERSEEYLEGLRAAYRSRQVRQT